VNVFFDPEFTQCREGELLSIGLLAMEDHFSGRSARGRHHALVVAHALRARWPALDRTAP